MPDKRLVHRGHEVEIRGTETEPDVRIDGEPLHAEHIGEGQYATGALPFANFSSLDDLARAVIDNSPVYHGRRER